MITLDFETKSYCDLKKSGTWAYSEHESTDVICACWAIDDGEVQEWWPHKSGLATMPESLIVALYDGHTIEAHNVAFEKSIWINVMQYRYDWPGRIVLYPLI